MKHLLSLMLMVSMAGVMSAKAQTALDLNEGLQVAVGAQEGEFVVSWWGKTGRTYFVQQSFDLMTWQYVPVIESGAEAVCGLNVSCSETRQFWKLRYTDAPAGGNAQTADFDGDGLANLDELYYGADPFKADSDDDSLSDYAEVMTHFTNPLLADTDGDTLSDSAEVNLHLTNPTLADTDGDALRDDAEINLHMTDPNDFDGDDDLLPDGWEVAHSLNPKSALGSHGTAGDPDADLLTNLGEYQHSTNPWDADTDDDTLSDYAEVMTHFTNPLLADTDGDTLSDSAEINLHLTSPTSWDTDGDNLSDGAEVLTHGSNPLSQDSDSDGLSDAAEVNTYQTNPNAADSDADGITDKSEIKQGANANSASSRPAFESVEVGGNGEAGERKTEQVTLTLPEGEKSYLVVVAVQSDEYPGFTGTASEYDDVVDWKITPAGGAVIEGEKHVNELHADWEQSQEEGTSFLGLSPVAIVATEIIKGKASGTTSVQIELGAKNVSDGALPSTVAAMVMPVEIEPDTGMAGVIGDVVKSADANSTVRHFVTPKKSTELNQDYVVLKAAGVTEEQITAGHPLQMVEWEGGEAVTNEPLKRRVPRAATGTGATKVKIKTKQGGATVAEMHVWVVWCDLVLTQTTPARWVPLADIQIPSGSKLPGATNETIWEFQATIQPASIISESERPKLDGAPSTYVPNYNAPHLDGSLLGQPIHKWDISRQVRLKILSPQIGVNAMYDYKGIDGGTAYDGLPNPNLIQPATPQPGADSFPQNKIEGNDDSGANSEDTDPYTGPNFGKLTDVDPPLNPFVVHETPQRGSTIEFRFHFLEFCRLEIGGKWYCVSEHKPWRFQSKLKKTWIQSIDDTDSDGLPSGNEGKMRDDGSVSDDTNIDW